MCAQAWTSGRLPLSDVVQLHRNPKDHDLGAIIESFFAFGFVEPIVINTRTGHLVHGHGRDDGLSHLHAAPALLHERFANDDGTLIPPPGVALHDDGTWSPVGIEVRDDGEWLVPVFYVEVPENREEALTIALNRTTELGGWNEPLLAQVLADIAAQGEAAIRGIGYDMDSVNDLTAHLRSLEQLQEQYGTYDERDHWPVIHVRVPPHVYGLWDILLTVTPGDDDSAKMETILRAADAALSGG